MVVVCLFFVNTVSWSYPEREITIKTSTLAPWTVFQRAFLSAGIAISPKLEKQIAFEIISGIRLLLADKERTCSAVNGMLIESYKDTEGETSKIEFLPGIQRESEGIGISANFILKGREDTVFEVTYQDAKTDMSVERGGQFEAALNIKNVDAEDRGFNEKEKRILYYAPKTYIYKVLKKYGIKSSRELIAFIRKLSNRSEVPFCEYLYFFNSMDTSKMQQEQLAPGVKLFTVDEDEWRLSEPPEKIKQISALIIHDLKELFAGKEKLSFSPTADDGIDYYLSKISDSPELQYLSQIICSFSNAEDVEKAFSSGVVGPELYRNRDEKKYIEDLKNEDMESGELLEFLFGFYLPDSELSKNGLPNNFVDDAEIGRLFGYKCENILAYAQHNFLPSYWDKTKFFEAAQIFKNTQNRKQKHAGKILNGDDISVKNAGLQENLPLDRLTYGNVFQQNDNMTIEVRQEKKTFFDRDTAGPLKIGHRIGSIEEAKRAIRLGAHALEVDVQLTKDGELVAFWGKVNTDSGEEKCIYEIDLAELVKNEHFYKREVMKIEDFLNEIRGKAAVNLHVIDWFQEIDSNYGKKVIGKIVQLINKYRLSEDAYIGAFADEYMKELREYNKDIAVGITVHKRHHVKKVLSEMIRKAKKMSADAIALYSEQLDEDIIERIHGEGLKVVVCAGEGKIKKHLYNMVDAIYVEHDQLYERFPRLNANKESMFENAKKTSDVASIQSRGLSRREFRRLILSYEEAVFQYRSLSDIERIHGKELTAEEIYSIAKKSNSLQNFKILDVGAGKGVFLAEFLDGMEDSYSLRKLGGPAKIEAHAFEVNEMQSEIKKENQFKQMRHSKVSQIEWTFDETAEDMPYGDNNFSLILSTRSLEYVYSPLQAIEECYRLLKIGGKASLALSLLNSMEYQSLKSKLNSRHYRDYREYLGHLYIEGINIFEEIRRLKEEGYNIGIYLVDRRGWMKTLTEVNEALEDAFYQSDGRKKSFPYSNFVVFMEKQKEDKCPLKFNCMLERVDDVVHRKYCTSEVLQDTTDFSKQQEDRLGAENKDEGRLLTWASRYLKKHPVNVHVGLLATPDVDGQLEQNMETLARSIAWHNTFGLNVRYVLEHDKNGVALRLLKDRLKELGKEPGLDGDALLACVGDPHVGKEVIDVRLESLEFIGKDRIIKDREYVVALKDDSLKPEILIPNYTAASAMGLSLAALRVAGDKLEKQPENKNEYKIFRNVILGKFRTIYERYEVSLTDGNSEFSEEELELMVMGCPATKLYYTILYALPPVIKAIEEINKYHEIMQGVLRAA